MPRDALRPRTRLTAIQGLTNPTPDTPSQQAGTVNPTASAPRSSLTWEPDGTDILLSTLKSHGPSVPVEAQRPLVNNDVLPQAPGSTTPLKKAKVVKKMADMSGSPTQSNEGRSYDQYRDLYDRDIPSSQGDTDHDHIELTGPHVDSQVSRISSSHEQRTLHEDETGAVKFDWYPVDHDGNAYDVNETEEEDDGMSDPPPSNSRPAMRSQSMVHTSATFGQHSMPTSTMPPPETPKVTQRPFQRDAPPENLMNPSQMFMQTQFTSGVKKLASPTSSRPSPMVFEHNTISPNMVSSPLKDRGIRTSPPTQGLATSPVYRVSETSSKPSEQQDQGPGLEIIPGSPNVDRPRLKTRPEPIGNYAPIRDSPTLETGRMVNDEVHTDSDSDETQERRRLARLKQERANKTLNSINFSRQNGKDNIEVPSTNRRKQKAALQSTISVLSSDDYVKQCHGNDDASKDDSQETVADSQEANAVPLVNKNATNTAGTMNAVEANLLPSTEPDLPSAPVRSNETTGSKETIPETSPAGNKCAQRNAKQEFLEVVFSDQPLRSSRRIISSQKPSSDEAGAMPSSPPIPLPLVKSSQASSARRSSRRGTTVTPVPALDRAENQEPITTSSTLTVLSETPHFSASSTPDTETADQNNNNNNKSSPAIGTAVSSPAAAKQLRKKPSRLKTYTTPGTRGSNRSSRMSRQLSMSTDELAPSTPISASNLRRSLVRKPTTSTESRQKDSVLGIFHGMTFATSFQSEAEKKSVEKMIISADGKILPRGFDELFEGGPLESDQFPRLKQGHSTGFTALITDTHSRKPKYLQALALGLPCLSWKWVSNCVRANDAVDWSTYLLCAGQSQILGAIRSRTLDAYEASNANLDNIIESRPLLLSNAKILLVMKKSKKEEERRMHYLFLAQVLGASLVRVSTLEEARAELKKKQAAGDSFDWVYVGGHPVDADKILFGAFQAAPKKRKSQSITEELNDPPPKRVRTLDDELLVQSLILGRLVEDGEMEDILP